MKHKKILIIANGMIGKDPGLSGGDVRFLEILKHWLAFGQKVEILSSETAYSITKKYGINVPIHIIPNPSESSERHSYIIRTIQTFFQFPQSLDTFHDGTVYSVNDSIFDVLPALKLKLRHPKTIKWAAVVHWIPPFPPWKRKKSGLINSILFYINVRLSIEIIKWFADVVLPVSVPTSEQVRKAGVNMKKVKPVKCGVEYEKIRAVASRVKDKPYDAVFMKRTQPVKGVFDLIDIWARIVTKRKDSKLIIIGDDGKDAEKVKDVIKEKGLENNITFAGYIFEFEEKIQKLSQGKVFILPSYEENWAIALGEAMAAGLPVIAYNLKELFHIWDPHVEWIKLGDTKLFAKKALEYIDNSNKANAFAKRNLPFIKKLSWESIAREELGYVL